MKSCVLYIGEKMQINFDKTITSVDDWACYFGQKLEYLADALQAGFDGHNNKIWIVSQRCAANVNKNSKTPFYEWFIAARPRLDSQVGGLNFLQRQVSWQWCNSKPRRLAGPLFCHWPLNRSSKIWFSTSSCYGVRHGIEAARPQIEVADKAR